MKTRNRAIDLMKGLLVIGMIWTHALQFFAYQTSEVAYWIETYGNVTSFAGFLFCFGYANQEAYFSKGFSRSYGRMIRTAIKILIAFYISGIFFRVFQSQTPIAWPPLRDILLLKDIPGWSEFLAGFFALTVVAIAMFRPLTWILEHKLVFWIVFFALFTTTWIPYADVTSTQLGLIIGTTKFASFPVVQYLPYYLLGMYFSKYKVVFDYRLMIGAVVGTLSFVVFVGRTGQLPSRFPPSILWIVSSLFLEYVYFLASRWFATKILSMRVFSSIGRNVLLYLLIGNVSLFTVKSVAGGYLYLTPWQCLLLAMLLMAFAAYMGQLAAVNRHGVYADETRHAAGTSEIPSIGG